MKRFNILFIVIIILLSVGCENLKSEKMLEIKNLSLLNTSNNETAIFAGGCFWCLEASFEQLDGVIDATAGYTGGKTENPTYEEVSLGNTGHYEAVKVVYDSKVIDYEKVLNFYWQNIDPTNDKGQFSDKGSQYRSAIFYMNEKQKSIAEKSKQELEKSGMIKKKIVTTILPATKFYSAEEYHQEYYLKNPTDYNFYKKGSGREEVLKIHVKGKPLAENVNLKEVSERTPGFSGADLANLANEAALLAARRNKVQIYQSEFLESIEKVLLGPERKSHVLSTKEKEIAAYHEAGHALVSASIAGTEPIRKISIISRGMAAGYTLQVPSEENRMRTKTQFLAELATLLGGYTAEKLTFGDITTGASNDLSRASDIARRLIKEYGMSSLGPIVFGEKEELVFLGKEISEQRNYSETVANKIDLEVEKFIRTAEKTATDILAKRKDLLSKIAKTLIEKETIEKDDFEKIMNTATGKTKK